MKATGVISQNKINVNLITNFYIDQDRNRQNEIEYCLIDNFRNPNLNRLSIIVCDELSNDRINNIISLNGLNIDKSDIVRMNDRPTYDDYFTITRQHQNEINIVSNSDIMFDEVGIKMMIDYFIERGNKMHGCMALSRWDMQKDYSQADAKLFKYMGWGSQDAWVFYGGVDSREEYKFILGKLGCDSKIAFFLSENGYDVINPSRTIKIYHLHLIPVHNYSEMERMPRPYKYIPISNLYGDWLMDSARFVLDKIKRYS